jgi:hypothetical protein
VRCVRSEIGTPGLTCEVSALRCGSTSSGRGQTHTARTLWPDRGPDPRRTVADRFIRTVDAVAGSGVGDGGSEDRSAKLGGPSCVLGSVRISTLAILFMAAGNYYIPASLSEPDKRAGARRLCLLLPLHLFRVSAITGVVYRGGIVDAIGSHARLCHKTIHARERAPFCRIRIRPTRACGPHEKCRATLFPGKCVSWLRVASC